MGDWTLLGGWYKTHHQSSSPEGSNRNRIATGRAGDGASVLACVHRSWQDSNPDYNGAPDHDRGQQQVWWGWHNQNSPPGLLRLVEDGPFNGIEYRPSLQVGKRSSGHESRLQQLWGIMMCIVCMFCWFPVASNRLPQTQHCKACVWSWPQSWLAKVFSTDCAASSGG